MTKNNNSLIIAPFNHSKLQFFKVSFYYVGCKYLNKIEICIFFVNLRIFIKIKNHVRYNYSILS